MHGIIHTELKGFVTSLMGVDGWRQVASTAGVSDTEYVSRQSYPDDGAAGWRSGKWPAALRAAA